MDEIIIRSKAPLRISFAGGGTDVEPYVSEKGGVVLNATINKYAYASLSPRFDGLLNVKSLDYDIVAKYNVNGNLPYDGKLDLVKAAIKMMNLNGEITFPTWINECIENGYTHPGIGRFVLYKTANIIRHLESFLGCS